MRLHENIIYEQSPFARWMRCEAHSHWYNTVNRTHCRVDDSPLVAATPEQEARLDAIAEADEVRAYFHGNEALCYAFARWLFTLEAQDGGLMWLYCDALEFWQRVGLAALLNEPHHHWREEEHHGLA